MWKRNTLKAKRVRALRDEYQQELDIVRENYRNVLKTRDEEVENNEQVRLDIMESNNQMIKQQERLIFEVAQLEGHEQMLQHTVNVPQGDATVLAGSRDVTSTPVVHKKREVNPSYVPFVTAGTTRNVGDGVYQPSRSDGSSLNQQVAPTVHPLNLGRHLRPNPNAVRVSQSAMSQNPNSVTQTTRDGGSNRQLSTNDNSALNYNNVGTHQSRGNTNPAQISQDSGHTGSGGGGQYQSNTGGTRSQSGHVSGAYQRQPNHMGNQNPNMNTGGGGGTGEPNKYSDGTECYMECESNSCIGFHPAIYRGSYPKIQ